MKRSKRKSAIMPGRKPVEVKFAPLSRVLQHPPPRLNLAPVIVRKELPAVEHIAIIAATLARNTDTGTQNSLVNFAMRLWHEAREQIITASERLDEGLEIFEEFDLPERKFFYQSFHEFPIASEQFLRTVLPKLKSRKAKLTQIAKEFVSSRLCEDNEKKPTTEEIDKAYSNWPSCKNEDEANKEAEHFLTWYNNQISKGRSSAGKKSAQRKAEAAGAAGMGLK